MLIKHLPLIVGGLGGGLLLVNRLAFTTDLATSQSRADALGISLSAVLILTGLLWQQAQPKPPERVSLEGESRCEWHANLTEAQRLELAWASHTILTCSPIRTLVIWWDDQVLVRRGILPAQPPTTLNPLAQRVISQQKPTYLVALKLYPARFEFNYLPTNSQSVLCQPLGERGVLVCATDTPRNLTLSDQAWLAAIADRLSVTLAAH